MGSQDISESTNRNALIACLVIASLFVFLRTYARFFKTKSFPLEPEDLAMYIALASFTTMCALYLSAMPNTYAAEGVMKGTHAPWPTMLKDMVYVLKEFFAVQIFFWLTLWSVKCSLMFMFQRLTTRVSLYVWVWRGVMGFTIATFVASVITHLLSCSSFHAWFTPGACATSRDATVKAISLWFALAVDLLTDLMIMIVPIQILYNLQVSKAQKYSIGIVFVVGLITIVVAIVRVVSLDSSVDGGQVSVYWLILWGGIEGCAAMITGCLPSFAVFIRAKVISSRATGTYGVSGLKPGQSIQTWRSRSKARGESVQLDDIEAQRVHSIVASPATPGAASIHGSTKSLVKGSILITQSWTQKFQANDSSSAESNELEHKTGVERKG